MSLSDTRLELVEGIQENLSILVNDPPMSGAAFEIEDASQWLIALGICNLLLYADVDRFYENLVRSGHARRHFLLVCQRQGLTSHPHLAISRWDAFLGVVAAGDFPLARDLVRLSTDQWVQDGEYEDDFCYRLFLHDFIAPPDPLRQARMPATLQRWRQWLGGQACPRLALCEALLTRDAAAFTLAFDERIAQRQAEVQKQSKMVIAANITFEPMARVFIEGLAILRMASRLGLPTRVDYPLCPAIARGHATRPFPDDIFPIIDAERQALARSAHGSPP
jgi:Immunity protein 49